MPSGAEGYLVCRASVPFPEKGDPITDKMIAAQRLDGRVLKGRNFSHCTFANVSFKEAKLTDSEFLDCTFVNCYFRRSRVINCRFVGSKFYGCEFPRIALQSFSGTPHSLHVPFPLAKWSIVCHRSRIFAKS
jgi:uncharacterized protein YjbI with pentapeptide repeats